MLRHSSVRRPRSTAAEPRFPQAPDFSRHAGFVAALLVSAAGAPAWANADLLAVSLLPDSVGGPAAMVEYDVQLDVDALEDAERLVLTLPSGLFEAERTSVQRQPHGYFWRGQLYGAWEVLVTVHKGKASGLIYTPSQVYELLPYADQLRLVALDGRLYPPCGTDSGDGLDAEDGSIPDGAQDDSGSPRDAADEVLPTVMDVLVVYTPQARDGVGGQSQIESVIQSAVNVTNTAYANSQVNAVIHLIHTAEAPFNDSGSSSTDLSNVRNDDVVANLRDVYGADMVGLIIHRNNSCGRGFVQRNPGPSFAGSAYQVTRRSCAVGNLSFAHEFGHNQGCEHDPENGTSPTNASFPFAFGHFQSGSYRTVMSYSSECTSGCPRAPHFSNGNVQRDGLDTGILDERENYRTINNTASIIADFRPPAVVVGVAQSAYEVSERDGRIAVTVGRSGRADIPVTVLVRTQGDEAESDIDFVATSTVLDWAAGDTSVRTVEISILDDQAVEGPEGFNVILEDPRGAGLGTVSQTRVTVEDYEEGFVQLTATSTSIREDGGQLVLEAERTVGADGEVSVSFGAESASANIGEDYALPAGQLTWRNGELGRKALTITVLDDRVIEGDESFVVVLSQPTGGARLGNARTTATIEDWEEGNLQFVTSRASVRENDEQVVLQVERQNGTDGAIAVQVNFGPGSPGADGSADYVDSAVQLTWPAGTDGVLPVEISILDDEDQEGEERFVATLVEATNGSTVGASNQATVAILDWEEGTLSFEEDSVDVAENAGTIEVEVLRADGRDGQVSVLVETEADTATEDADFVPESQVLRWRDGDTSPKTLSINLVADDLEEGPEAFWVRLSDAEGGRLGETVQLEVNIVDVYEPEGCGCTTAERRRSTPSLALSVFALLVALGVRRVRSSGRREARSLP